MGAGGVGSREEGRLVEVEVSGGVGGEEEIWGGVEERNRKQVDRESKKQRNERPTKT